MKNKGFTLVEMILVVVIIGIVSVIAVPNIMEAVENNRKESGKSLEKIIKYNLKLYNIDNEEDIWQNDQLGCKKGVIAAKDFKSKYDIDMGECLFTSDDALAIEKDASGNYKYYASIVCGKKLKENYDTNKDAVVDSGTVSGAYYGPSSLPSNCS